ncbi:hypothetical protein Hanom_Chr07g00672381 [Helianthus anomalus]
MFPQPSTPHLYFSGHRQPPFTPAMTTPTTTAPPHLTYLDENWKLSKKESISRSRSSTSSLIRNSSSSATATTVSHRRCAFTRKCARLVKEQRARFYIMRRCVTMLVCWRDYSDS